MQMLSTDSLSKQFGPRSGLTHEQIQKVLSEGSNSVTFLVDERRREDPINTKSRPLSASLAHQ